MTLKHRQDEAPFLGGGRMVVGWSAAATRCRFFARSTALTTQHSPVRHVAHVAIATSRATISFARRRTVRNPRVTFAVLASALLSGCERLPEHVYILDALQSIELDAFAAAQTVRPGTPVVLHARRTTQGTWRRIRSRDLMPKQCWMARVPPPEEPEVADNVHWRVEPANTATFNVDFRPDHTRTVTLSEPGLYTFTPSTGAWCEPGRQVLATPFRITVQGP